MSELKSIGRLQAEVIKWVGTEDWRTMGIHDKAHRLVDAIEAEIAERFVELPCDRDGRPVHVGDRVRLLHNGVVRMVECLTLNAGGVWCVACDSGGAFLLPESQGNVEHAKPRALEDVLKELACDVRREWVENAPLAEHVYSEYADEIRELLEVDDAS